MAPVDTANRWQPVPTDVCPLPLQTDEVDFVRGTVDFKFTKDKDEGHGHSHRRQCH